MMYYEYRTDIENAWSLSLRAAGQGSDNETPMLDIGLHYGDKYLPTHETEIPLYELVQFIEQVTGKTLT